MRAVRLLEHALTKKPETVLDVGVGPGWHAMPFLAQGSSVTGIDVSLPHHAVMDHENYTHIQTLYEQANALEDAEGNKFGDRKYDMIWCNHVLEHIPNSQHFLMWLRGHLKPGGWLFLAVPSSRQNRLHIGHCSLWTPAHLVYNLIIAGWDCKDANWYTEYLSIAICLQRVDDIDMSGRTALPSEHDWLNKYSPIKIYHEDGAWWGNRWHEEGLEPRAPDPPFVTVGYDGRGSLPPEMQLHYGPNPELRKGYERDEES